MICSLWRFLIDWFDVSVIKEEADESDGSYELDSEGIRISEVVSASGEESYVIAYREEGEGENKVFVCGFCDKTFKTKGHLKVRNQYFFFYSLLYKV